MNKQNENKHCNKCWLHPEQNGGHECSNIECECHAVQDNKGTWEERFEKMKAEGTLPFVDYKTEKRNAHFTDGNKLKSFIANERKAAFAEGVEDRDTYWKHYYEEEIEKRVKAAQEEVVREILKRKTEYRHINYVPNESSWGFTEAVSVKDIEEVAKEKGIDLSISKRLV